MRNNLDNLIDLQKVLQEDGVLISFSGRFAQEVIEELGDAVKKYLETDATSMDLRLPFEILPLVDKELNNG